MGHAWQSGSGITARDASQSPMDRVTQVEAPATEWAWDCGCFQFVPTTTGPHCSPSGFVRRVKLESWRCMSSWRFMSTVASMSCVASSLPNLATDSKDCLRRSELSRSRRSLMRVSRRIASRMSPGRMGRWPSLAKWAARRFSKPAVNSSIASAYVTSPREDSKDRNSRRASHSAFMRATSSRLCGLWGAVSQDLRAPSMSTLNAKESPTQPMTASPGDAKRMVAVVPASTRSVPRRSSRSQQARRSASASASEPVRFCTPLAFSVMRSCSVAAQRSAAGLPPWPSNNP
mmetsp:Transcript_2277/g.6762  ORF Transcript_2277/g.6762 Transcript_2277/m.6762 type:complete len:289 (+) Transcript_2277:437-1303(+)